MIMDGHGENEAVKKLILRYWEAMNANNFRQASEFLSEDFICRWPQSGELIRGRENFICINAAYPVNGSWKFQIRRLLAEGDQAVTEVIVSDDSSEARVITFHKAVQGFIREQTEFWPDNYPAPDWRRNWVEKL